MEHKEFALDFAKRAGIIIKDNFSLGMKRDWKSDNTPVTITDISINRMLIEDTEKYFPDHDVKGEEEKSLRNNSEYLWVCDPVDGTIPFSHGIPICTFSLALVKNGEPILGVAYDPFMDRMFFAEKGKGSYLNNQAIKVSSKSTLLNSLIGYEAFARAKYDIKELSGILEALEVKTSKFNSFIYTGVLVAAGEFVASIFPNTTAHDIASLKIIVEEAGGKVTDLFGEEQRYDQEIKGAIVSNGLVHDQLVEIVGKLIKRID